MQLLRASRQNIMPGGRRSRVSTLEERAERANNLAHLGELSAARQALEAAELAPGNEDALNQLNARPQSPHDPMP